MESNDGQPSLKRLRATTSSEVHTTPVDKEQQKPTTTSATSKNENPPSYGSQEYWEERYRSQLAVGASSDKKEESSQQGTLTSMKSQEDSPDPFHAWYFNYEELAPIMLPLILGDNADATQDENGGNTGDSDEEENDEAGKTDLDSSRSARSVKHESTIRGNTTGGEGETIKEKSTEARNILEDEDNDKDWGGFEEVGSEEEEEEEAPSRKGLARDGPITVLEVGCGDVPLGRDLALGIENLPVNDVPDFSDKGSDSGEGLNAFNPTRIVTKVVCLDYSENVIGAMKALQKDQEVASDRGYRNVRIPIDYEVADARDLPYADRSYQLILEKGTLDAMLSDREKGSNNCIAIVKEMSRVLSIGGEYNRSRL